MFYVLKEAQWSNQDIGEEETRLRCGYQDEQFAPYDQKSAP